MGQAGHAQSQSVIQIQIARLASQGIKAFQSQHAAHLALALDAADIGCAGDHFKIRIVFHFFVEPPHHIQPAFQGALQMFVFQINAAHLHGDAAAFELRQAELPHGAKVLRMRRKGREIRAERFDQSGRSLPALRLRQTDFLGQAHLAVGDRHQQIAVRVDHHGTLVQIVRPLFDLFFCEHREILSMTKG